MIIFGTTCMVVSGICFVGFSVTTCIDCIGKIIYDYENNIGWDEED